MDTKITVASKHSNGDRPTQQRWLMQHAVYSVLRDHFDHEMDLRGYTISVTLHSDGVHATAELLPPGE